MLRGLLILLVALWLPLAPAAAQDSTEADKDFITRFLEGSLSGADRQVTLKGFSGALSSRATFEELSIADDAGIWLTIRNGAISWDRGALLSRRIEIGELSASEVELPRLPGRSAENLPSPEARPFSLPELPVAINIGKIAVDKVRIGQPVMGIAAEISLKGSMSLDGGEGQARIDATRVDGRQGTLRLQGAYSNTTRHLSVDLALDEAANGIAANLMGLHDRPALRMTVLGEGPLDDFEAEIQMATDGQQRLNGFVVTATANGPGTNDTHPGRRFEAQLIGDISPLLPPENREFFGNESLLYAKGWRGDDGQISLPKLEVATGQATLNGRAEIAASGAPQLLDVQLAVSPDADISERTLLPLSGLRIRSGEITLNYDKATGEGWALDGKLRDVLRDDMAIETLRLLGDGTLTETNGKVEKLDGVINFTAAGIAPDDPALAQAIGSYLSGQTQIHWQDGQALRLSTLRVNGDGYSAHGDLQFDQPRTGIVAQADLRADYQDLDRLSGIAGRKLSGQAELAVKGVYTLLSGSFDGQITASGNDIALDQAELDQLLRGRSTISLDAARDKDGTRIRALSIDATQLTAQASGLIRTGASDIAATLSISGLQALNPKYGGALNAEARLVETMPDQSGPVSRHLSLNGVAQELRTGITELDGALNGSTDLKIAAVETGGLVSIETLELRNPQLSATASGQLGAGQTDARAVIAMPDLSVMGRGWNGAVDLNATLVQGNGSARRFTVTGTGQNLAVGQAQADAILRGSTAFSVGGRQEAGVLRLDNLQVSNPQITATARGVVSGVKRQLTLDARLADLGIIAPDFPGPATLSGTARESGSGYDLDLRATGPGGTDATISGPIDARARNANLIIRGNTNAAIATPFLSGQALDGPISFDLRLNGRPDPEALSGRISGDALRFADPALGISLPKIALSADLANGRAVLDGRAQVSAGGLIRVTGPVGLGGDRDSNLQIVLDGVTLRDPDLYETRLNGQLALTGSLTRNARISGLIRLDETEIRVPSTGLGGSATPTNIRHRGDRPPVRGTRRRAGLLAEAAAKARSAGESGSSPIALDITISAENRIFVRGRGLDAELGGQLRLSGTTANLIPQGQFDLRRGRLDILGKRFTLDEGKVRLDGTLVPYIIFGASNENDGLVSMIRIEGPADSPEVQFSSMPELAEEEVIAHLLFSRGLDKLSAFQAAQLASAIATLAGKGGVGIVGKLRNSFGLDDLDVSTSDSGQTTVKAGKYLSDNLYTDVEVGADGKSRINLNLEITPNLTARGATGTDGNSSIGLFFEKDY